MSLKQQRVVVIGGNVRNRPRSGASRARERRERHRGLSSAAKVRAAQDQLAGAEALTVDVKDEASVEAFFARVDALDHLVFTAGDWAMAGGGPIANLDVAGAASQFAVRFWGAHHLHQARGEAHPRGRFDHAHRRDDCAPPAQGRRAQQRDGRRRRAPRPRAGRGPRADPGQRGVSRRDPHRRVGHDPADQREERFQTMFKRLPAKRIGEPSEVAEAYLYLMRGGYTTGQVLHVDGGAMVI